jgi:hypothetical protein
MRRGLCWQQHNRGPLLHLLLLWLWWLAPWQLCALLLLLLSELSIGMWPPAPLLMLLCGALLHKRLLLL